MSVTDEVLQKFCDLPRDEFGVRILSLINIKEAGRVFCLLDAPDVISVENHHGKAGVKCDWITEVTLIRPSGGTQTLPNDIFFNK